MGCWSQNLSNRFLKVFLFGGLTTSSGKLFHTGIILLLKKFLLVECVDLWWNNFLLWPRVVEFLTNCILLRSFYKLPACLLSAFCMLGMGSVGSSVALHILCLPFLVAFLLLFSELSLNCQCISSCMGTIPMIGILDVLAPGPCRAVGMFPYPGIGRFSLKGPA